jgi:rubrerythrin
VFLPETPPSAIGKRQISALTYTEAANQVTSPATQKLFSDLAEEEEDHQDLPAEEWKENKKSATSL